MRGICSGNVGRERRLTGLIRFLANAGMLAVRKARHPFRISHFPNITTGMGTYVQNDWITRDRSASGRYNADPQCTFLFTDRAAYDFANLVDDVSGEYSGPDACRR